MKNNHPLYLLLGLGVLFLGAIVVGTNPTIPLPVPFSIDYLVFIGGQIVNDAINAAISGILSLPWWVLVAIFALLVMLGAGYSDESDADSGIVPVPATDSSTTNSDSDWVTKGTRSAAIAVNKASAGVTAIGHGAAITLAGVGERVKESNIISIDFALAQITGVSVTIAGVVRSLFGDNTDEE